MVQFAAHGSHRICWEGDVMVLALGNLFNREGVERVLQNVADELESRGDRPWAMLVDVREWQGGRQMRTNSGWHRSTSGSPGNSSLRLLPCLPRACSNSWAAACGPHSAHACRIFLRPMRLPAGTGCVNRGWRSARQTTRTMVWHDRDCVMPDPLFSCPMAHKKGCP